MPIQEIVDHVMPSLTEWLEKINPASSEAFRAEDNTKRDRLEVLYQTIGLPYDRPERVTARDIVDNTPRFQEILGRKGDDKCALRLVPRNPELPKLRVRGKSLRENLVWFHEQSIDPDEYKVEIIPHPDETPYASIFVINNHGVWGEIVPGWHWQLTQGIQDHPVTTFTFDFATWQVTPPNEEIENVVRRAVESLRIIDPGIQTKLETELEAAFTPQGYLKGYYEFVILPNGELQFIDYNRVLYQMLSNLRATSENNQADIRGTGASAGRAEGRVRIVLDPRETHFAKGDILVCPMTMVEFVPLMKRAGAIITDQGNMLSHAAIVSRELGIPCIVGTKNATERLKDGDMVLVEADTGSIWIKEKQA